MQSAFPEPNTTEDLQLVSKNDEHHAAMVNDDAFMTQVTQRNDQANQAMNLNHSELTNSGNNAAQNAKVLVANDHTDWINKKWRPVMGWIYMLTCTMDFVIFPILWSLLQAMSKGSVTMQWQPLTLQGAGLYHIAMGAVLGIAAYGRTKEKIEGKS